MEEVVSGQPVMAMVVMAEGAVSLWQQSLLRLRKHSMFILVAVEELVLVPLRNQVAVAEAEASLVSRGVRPNLLLLVVAAEVVEVITLQLLMAVPVV